MDGWNEGQLGLFDALAKVCDNVSAEDASELARSIANRNGISYAEELRHLRARSSLVGELQQENERLRKELEECIDKLAFSKETTVVDITAVPEPDLSISEPKPSATTHPTLSVQRSFSNLDENDPTVQPITPQQFPHASDAEVPGGTPGSTRDLINKYNGMYLAWKRALKTKENLAMKRKEEVKKWSRYADHLENQLTKHGIAVPKKGSRQEPILPSELGDHTTPTSSKAPRQDLTLPLESGRHELLVSSGDLILEPGLPSDDKVESLTNGERRQPMTLPPISSRLHVENDTSNLPSHHSSSTQGDADDTPTHEASDGLRVFIKAESPCDTPVVISSRSVRKPKSHNVTAVNTPGTVRVKIEVSDLSSSPLPLARLRSLDPHESMDLDEVGQRVDTPKKQRLLLEASRAKTKPKLSGTDAVEASFRHVPSAKSSALQPKSPNKQILPRTSDSARATKRRRLDDRIAGAEFLAEDGENEHANRRGPSEQFAKLSFDKGSFNPKVMVSPLDDLLNVPSPQRNPITPMPVSSTLVSNTNTTTPLQRRKQVEVAQPETAKPRKTVNNMVKQASKGLLSRSSPAVPSTVKKRGPRTKEELTAVEAEDPDHEPFRARPLRRLGLEHFKINPDVNQGYDYAFADVVRGREQRKCLPGCTKPECCGNTFRRLAEMTAIANEEQTASQEEQDHRLLEEFLGNNKVRLQNMSQDEKNELLLQARARDLAKKHGKHRQTYERRKSPPGFWRADFPTTQEEEEDRAEAGRFERHLVEKRYNEAMREDGQWKFRDE